MKRSDLDTTTALLAVAKHRLRAYEALCTTFPEKVVQAAFHREVQASRLNYGVAAHRPWLEPKGEAWLRDHGIQP